MAPFFTFDGEINDMGEAKEDIAQEGEDLVPKEFASFYLSDTKLIFVCTDWALSSESNTNTYNHGDKSERNIKRECIIEWHQVDIDQGGGEENSLSEPFNHVENSN